MTGFTAKVRLTNKVGSPGSETKILSFSPDYQDGRNKEWALATPNLSLSMSVKTELADKLDEGTSFTLTFDPDLPVAGPED